MWFLVPVVVSLCEGDSRLDGGSVQSFHWVFKGKVRVHSSEAAEIMNPHQQGGGLAHASNIQLPDEWHQQTFKSLWKMLTDTLA